MCCFCCLMFLYRRLLQGFVLVTDMKPVGARWLLSCAVFMRLSGALQDFHGGHQRLKPCQRRHLPAAIKDMHVSLEHSSILRRIDRLLPHFIVIFPID